MRDQFDNTGLWTDEPEEIQDFYSDAMYPELGEED